MTSRERFEAFLKTKHADYDDASKMLWEFWQAAERGMLERCLKIVSTYQFSVGNSRAGEIACELTMENIREIHAELKELLNEHHPAVALEAARRLDALRRKAAYESSISPQTAPGKTKEGATE